MTLLRSRRWLLPALIGLMVALALGVAWAALRPAAYAYNGGEYLPPQAVPSLPLADVTGAPFDLADRPGRVTLLYFGYTTCPDLCPTTLSDFSVIKTELGEQAAGVDFALLTFDPARDTPDRLAQYLSFFDPDFIGLRGTDAQTRAAMQSFGVSTKRVEHPESATGYLIDHTALIYVIDQAGRLRLSYPYGTPPAAIAADVAHLLETDATTR